MVAEATAAGRKRVRRTRKGSKRDDDPDSSAIEDSDLFNSTRPRPLVSKFSNSETSSTKKKTHKTKAKSSADCDLNESSDFFADDESGTEIFEPSVQLTHRPPSNVFDFGPVSQPDTGPNYQRWPYKPLLKPEHYDAWSFPDFQDPQENIFSIYREFLLPSNLASLRNVHLRTDRGLVDLDIVAPCVPGSPCILDRMCYRDRVCHTCYDQQRLRNYRGYY